MPENTDASASKVDQESPEAQTPLWKSVLSQIQESLPEQYRQMFSSEIPPQEENQDASAAEIPDVSIAVSSGVLTFSRSNIYDSSGSRDLSHPPYSIAKLIYEPYSRAKIILEELVVTSPTIRAVEGSVVYRSASNIPDAGRVFTQEEKGFESAKDKFLRKVKNISTT